MNDLSPRELAAVLKALLDAIKPAYEQVCAQRDDRLRKLYESDGVTTQQVRLPGIPVPVAQVTLTPPEAAVAVDRDAQVAWCRQRYPTEVETVTPPVPKPYDRVRPAFEKVLMARLKVDDDDGKVIDTETGEVIGWARQVPAGPGKTTMTFKPDGRKMIAAAYQAGLLALPDLLALPPGADA